MRPVIERRGARVRSQDGYVLAVVLAAMTVGLLLITALLSLSFSTHRAARNQEQSARENRAVDAALDTAITRVRSSFATSAVPEPCAPFKGASPELDTIDFTDGRPSGSDDVPVHLLCDEVLDTSGEASGSVWIVGDDYTHGSLTDAVDWAGSGWDWTGALGSGNEPDASLSPSLVHLGEQPLRFIGGTNVASGTAALRSDGAGEAAVLVDGDYKQGAQGHLGSSGDCGMLDLVLSPTARTVILDGDGAPQCSDADAAAPQTPVLNETPPVDVPTVPGCGPPGDLVSLAPGHYDTASIKTLNRLFAGSGPGSCPGRIFNFTPGEYFFDMADATTNALVFADASSAYIFGTLDDATAPPDEARCKEGSAGAKVVFSGRSTFKHLAGNVDICGNPGQPTLVQSALAPSEITLSNAVANNPCGAWGASCPDFASVDHVLSPANSGEDATARINCFGGGADCNRSFSVDMAAEGGRQLDDLRVIWASSEVPQAHSSNRSVNALLRKDGTTLCDKKLSRAGRTPGFHSEVHFDLAGTDCPGLGPGATEGALDGATLTLKFTYPPNTYLIGEAMALSVRGVEVLVNADEGGTPNSVTSPTGNWSAPDAVARGDGTWTESTETDCNFDKTYYNPYPWWPFQVKAPRFCWRGDNNGPGVDDGPATLTLQGFDFGSGPTDLRPTDVIDHVFLAVDNHSDPCPPDAAGGIPVDCSSVAGTTPYPNLELGSTTVDLSWHQDGTPQDCSIPMQNASYTWSENTYMIDLVAPGTECEAELEGQPIGLLSDLEVDFTITPERGAYFDTWHPFPFVKRNRFEWAGLQVPSIEHMRLVATTSTAREIMRATITSDPDAGTRFKVHGDSVLPRTSANLRWKGADSPGTEPLFKGTLWIDSIASVADPGAQVGVVCCGDGQKVVRVIAELPNPDVPGDWMPAGVAKAKLEGSEAAPGLAAAVITSWEFCRSEGCDTGADSVITPSP